MLEVCVEDVAGVDAAIAGGVDRLEVCSALALGGLTPSPALVAYAAAGGAPVRALIRPRAGDFFYGEAELALMEADISTLLCAGAQGLVLGAADADGELDPVATARLIDTARRCGGTGIGLTLHRMIDLVSDPVATLGLAAKLGFDCVLTSGGATCALDGAPVLARMVAAAPPGLTVMAGAGVTPSSAPELLVRSGASALHASARTTTQSPSRRLVSLGLASPIESETSVATIRKLRAILNEHT